MSDTERAEDTRQESRMILLAALAVGVLALGLYLRTLHPGVGPSYDSMELQIAALTGGIIHPPGSPQYLLLGGLAMRLLPGPDAAYRLNLLSALFGAAAVSITFLLTHRLTENLIISSFAALTLALSPRLWYQSSITELYALNAFYVALVTYLLITWHQTRSPAAFWSAVLVYAFSFGNHLTMILLLPVFIYVVEITDRSMLLRPRHLAITAGIVLLAAAQYLVIPLRAAADPAFCNYCPDLAGPLLADLRELADYISGGPFKAAMFGLPRRAVLARLPDSIGLVARQFMPWGLALGVIGAWELFQRRAELAWTIIIGLLLEYAFVMTYDIPDWHDFLTPAYVLFVPLLGYGVLSLWELLQPESEALLIRGRQFAGYAIPGMLLVAGVFSLAVMLYTHLPLVDQREDTTYAVHSRALLSAADPGAWVLIPSPNSPAFYYSWAVRYVSLAEDLPPGDPPITMITPPEIDEPAGPPPYYRTWASVEDDLSRRTLPALDHRVFALDWADERLADWGLLAVCTDDGAIAGYELVAVQHNGEIVSLVSAGRWARIAEFVQFEGGDYTCPPSR